MWKVDRPEQGDIKAQLDAALIRADGTPVYALSVAELEEIENLYGAYDGLLGEPDPSLQPATLDACKDALHTAYNQLQKGARLAGLRGELLAAVLECPMCGFDAATTLDHHLPKDDYRALAIYPRNLVPCCQPCNRNKGTLDPAAGEGMIHAYFQELPAIDFLVADIAYDAGNLVATFKIDPIVVGTLGERLAFQLERLKLNDRYFNPINLFLFSLKPSVKMFRGKDGEAELIRDFLLASAKDYDGDFGLNHWKGALMRGLAASGAFLADPWSYFDRPLHEIKAA